MNPNTGKLHEAIREAGLDESIEAVLERGTDKGESSDPYPLQGPTLPPDWPRFVEGQELRQIKGWKLVLETVNLESQRLIVRLEKR